MNRAENTRILYTVNDAGYFLSHRLPIARAAREAGYDVHVATPPDEVARRIVAEGFRHHPVTLSRRGGWLWQEAASLWRLIRLYRRLRPDLVHHVTIKPVLYGGIAARLTRVPAVVNAIPGLGYLFIVREPRAVLPRWLATRAYRLALAHPNSRAIFQNPDDRRTFIQRGIVQEAGAVLIRGSGVDPARFVPRPEPEGEPVVMLASRMLWDKGVGEFVRAARRLRGTGLRARFVLVGETDNGNPRAIPQAQLEAWRAGDDVEWWGGREDMPAVIAQSALVCLPSAYGEGVPKVLIEAAACGRPIVTTDWPGCREVVRDGENGLLVPVRDAEALAGAIRRLIADPALRRRMGRRGREIAEREFSEERVVCETLAVYGELLA